MTRAISIGWPGLIGKCRSIFLRYSKWSLIGQFGIIDSTGNFPVIPIFRNLRPTSQGRYTQTFGMKFTYAVAVPAAVFQVCGQYMSSLNVCFIRFPTRNFRYFWSNETFLYGSGVPLLIPMFLFMIIFKDIDDQISRLFRLSIILFWKIWDVHRNDWIEEAAPLIDLPGNLRTDLDSWLIGEIEHRYRLSTQFWNGKPVKVTPQK